MDKNKIIDEILTYDKIAMSDTFKFSLKALKKLSIEEIKEIMSDDAERCELELLLIEFYDVKLIFDRLYGFDKDTQKDLSHIIEHNYQFEIFKTLLMYLKNYDLLAKYFDYENVLSYASESTANFIKSYNLMNEFLDKLSIILTGDMSKSMVEIKRKVNAIKIEINANKESLILQFLIELKEGLDLGDLLSTEMAFENFYKMSAHNDSMFAYELYSKLIELINMINESDIPSQSKLIILGLYQEYETARSNYLKTQQIMLEKSII